MDIRCGGGVFVWPKSLGSWQSGAGVSINEIIPFPLNLCWIPLLEASFLWPDCQGPRLVGRTSTLCICLNPTEVGTKSPAHAKKRVQMSDNAPPGGLPGQCAWNCVGTVHDLTSVDSSLPIGPKRRPCVQSMRSQEIF